MTIEEIGIGLYETVRKEAVRMGFLPDITEYLPDNESGYNEAKKQLGASLIDVIGGGQWKNRQNKDVNSVVINFIYPMPSKIGVMGGYSHVPDGDRFKVVKESKTIYDLYFQITYITKSELIVSRCEQLLIQALGRVATIKAYDLDGTEKGVFSAIRNEPYDVSAGEYYERGYRFVIEGVDLQGGVEIGSVAKFSAFELNLKSMKEKFMTNVINIKVYDVADNSETILTTEEGDEMDFRP